MRIMVTFVLSSGPGSAAAPRPAPHVHAHVRARPVPVPVEVAFEDGPGYRSIKKNLTLKYALAI